MAEEPEVQIDASTGKVRIGANAYEDLRPLIQSPVKLASGILAVVENLLGLPIDYVNIRLCKFREKLRIRLEAIPNEQRQLPPLQITSQVLRDVASCVDEEVMEDMFASLLASASNKETAGEIHPAFPSMIMQLASQDAELLTLLPRRMLRGYDDLTMITIDKVRFATGNIIRLGLAKLTYSTYEATQDLLEDRRFSYQKLADYQVEEYPEERKRIQKLEQQIKLLAANVQEASRAITEPNGVELTALGRQFLKTCLRPEPNLTAR